MLNPDVLRKQIEKEELQSRAEQYDFSLLTPFSTPDSYEVFDKDDSFPLGSFIEKALRKKQFIKNENNRNNACCNEERIAARVVPVSVVPADNMGSVKYQPCIYGGYDGGVEAGFEGSWRKVAFLELTERLAVAKQAADDGDDEKKKKLRKFWRQALESFR
jgi:hypothetical protein